MPKRGENIHKRKDGRWEWRYRDGISSDGTAHLRSVYGKSYREVKEKMSIILKNDIHQNPTTLKEKRFADAVCLWLDVNRVRIKGATENKYCYMIEKHLLPDLGTKKLSYLTTAAINQFLEQKLSAGRLNGDGGLSTSYVKTMAIIIDSVLKFSASEGFCQPLRTQIYKPQIVKKEIQILTPEVQQQLESLILSELNETKLGTFIALNTGLRIGEVCALTWEDIDLNVGIIHVRHTVSRVKCDDKEKAKTKLIIDEPKTEASIRDIPISSVLFPVLIEMRQKAKSYYVVSTTNKFVSTRTFDYHYRKMFVDMGTIQVNFHTLRHTFATRCVDKGMDVKSLSEILGHADPSTTLKTYVHPSMEMKRVQIEKLYA